MEDGLAVALQKRVNKYDALLRDLHDLKDGKKESITTTSVFLKESEEQLFKLSESSVTQTEFDLSDDDN